MKIFFTKNWQSGQKIKKRFLLSFIALIPMMFVQGQCPAVNVPYTEDFATATVMPSNQLPTCTTGENAGEGSQVWKPSITPVGGFTGKYLTYFRSTMYDGDAWFFTRGVNLVANTMYKISYDYGGSDPDLIESLKVACGTIASSGGMTVQLADHPEIFDGGRTSNSINFTPATSGVYYFGFNAYSRPNQANLNLDDITVVAAVPVANAPAIANFTSTTVCGESTLLTINGTNLANAAVTIGGTTVTLSTNTATQITATISTAMSGPVVVTTASGMTASANSFTFALRPALALNGTTTLICAGTASNAVTLTDGASDYTVYTWTPADGVTGSNTAGWVFNPTNTTSYVLNASNPTTGCSKSANYTVETIPLPATPVITASSALTMCEGSNLVLTSSAATGNVWSTNATTKNITVTNSGSYTVSVTSNGCTATSVPAVVTVTPRPVAGLSLTGNVTLTAIPAGQTYQWVNCTTNVPVSGATGVTFTATANGSYKVIVTNAGGCKDTSACVNVSKVGLAENSMDIGVSLYPNPTEGNLYITMTETEAADVVVFDAHGKVVLTMNNILNGNVIDMKDSEKGIYLVKISNAKETNVFRMVKK